MAARGRSQRHDGVFPLPGSYAVISVQQAARYLLGAVPSPAACLAQPALERQSISLKTRASLLLLLVQSLHGAVAALNGAPHLGDSPTDGIKLALDVADHSARLFQLRQRCSRLARVGDRIELGLVSLVKLPVLRDARLELAVAAFLDFEFASGLGRSDALSVARRCKGLQARGKLAQAALERVDLRVVSLELEERGYVWVHEASLIPVGVGERPSNATPPAREGRGGADPSRA